jgi:hypothetical protein
LPVEAKAGRDTREPGKDEKEKSEQALYKLIGKIWKAQLARINEHVRYYVPVERMAAKTSSSALVSAKANPSQADLAFIERMLDREFWELEDELVRGQLIELLSQMADRGVDLNGEFTRIQLKLELDTTLTNAKASKWARKYAGTLARNINQTTRDVIKQRVSNWIETPGATMKDLVDALPFNEKRAWKIAVTEVTQAYGEGERLYTQSLQNAYPTLKLVRVWYTNNDDKVCPICSQLDGKAIPIDGGWGQNGENDPEGLQGVPAHPGCRCWTGRNVVTD